MTQDYLSTISASLQYIANNGLKQNDSWVTITLAFSTLALAAAAFTGIFWPDWKQKRNRPNLFFQFENSTPFCRDIPKFQNPETKEIKDIKNFWVRLRVKNDGHSVAKNCEVKLIAIAHPDLGSVRQDFDPVVLRWVGNYSHNTSIDINADEYEYANLFLTLDGDNRFHISAIDYDIPRGITLDPPRDNYFLWVTIYSENAEPYSRVYKVISNQTYNKIKLQVASEKEKEKFKLLLS